MPWTFARQVLVHAVCLKPFFSATQYCARTYGQALAEAIVEVIAIATAAMATSKPSAEVSRKIFHFVPPVVRDCL